MEAALALPSPTPHATTGYIPGSRAWNQIIDSRADFELYLMSSGETTLLPTVLSLSNTISLCALDH
jgi:hypothetical protein